MATFQLVYEMIDPETGETYKQGNLKQNHKIPLDSIVEVLPYDSEISRGDHAGLRLYVVAHTRDCDGTPLYSLSFNKTAEVQENLEASQNYVLYDKRNPRYHYRAEPFMTNDQCRGFAEENLKVITPGPTT
jgi:hypothetical protein